MNSPDNPPTLEDVARLAGVSTATVSRCLNGGAPVAADTRARVEAAVAELGYAPNLGARALVTRRSGTVGAVIPTLASAIFAGAVESFQAALADAGLTLLLASSNYNADTEARHIRTLCARGVDGLLLVGAQRDRSVYAHLEQRRVPYVIGWTTAVRRGQWCVGIDNTDAARALAERVLALGHRRLAYISAPLAVNDRARGRLAGVRSALSDAGLDPAAMPVVEVPYEPLAAGEAFESLMAAAIRPTVVLCGNDVQAAGAVSRARAMGLDVPGAVSIVGFDDLEHARLVDPPVTTVHVPHRELGERAAQLLVAQIEGQRVRRVNALDTRLVERGSLGVSPG